jgi:hypothetical protein
VRGHRESGVSEKNPQENPFNGAPLTPGNPGNTGGKKGRSGRPPSVIRNACAKAFDRRIKYLMAVVDGNTGPYLKHKDGQVMLDDAGKPIRWGADVADRLKAMDLLGKYGGLQKVETEHVHKHYREAIEEAREALGLRLVS